MMSRLTAALRKQIMSQNYIICLECSVINPSDFPWKRYLFLADYMEVNGAECSGLPKSGEFSWGALWTKSEDTATGQPTYCWLSTAQTRRTLKNTVFTGSQSSIKSQGFYLIMTASSWSHYSLNFRALSYVAPSKNMGRALELFMNIFLSFFLTGAIQFYQKPGSTTGYDIQTIIG